MNLFFKDSQKHLLTEKIDGTVIYTMHPTDHLMYWNRQRKKTVSIWEILKLRD